MSTIGVDFIFKYYIIQDKTVKLQIWDTSGQEKYRSIAPSYFKNAQGIVLVYDSSDQLTFEDVKSNYISL
jgi:Ras-related protein Rab-1A